MGGSPGSWLTAGTRRRCDHVLRSADRCSSRKTTHAAGRSDPMTSAAAAARTTPGQRARRGCAAAPPETGRPRPPRTEPSGTTPGSTGRAAGWPRNGTLLLDEKTGRRRRQCRDKIIQDKNKLHLKPESWS